jgi:6-phosphogluconolactonase
MSAEIEIASPSALARGFAVRLAVEVRRAVAAGGRFALAISGGSAAELFVPAWNEADVDWSRVELFWVDERAVPADHPGSNFGLALRSGLDRLPLRAEALHRLPADADDLERAAASADRDLRAALGEPPRVDLALVGIGTDGHVASLFPGHAALAERERLVAAVRDAPKPPPCRLTWTLAAFARVDLLVVAALGAAKAEAVAAAREPQASTLPIALAAALAARRLMLVDEAAARHLAR